MSGIVAMQVTMFRSKPSPLTETPSKKWDHHGDRVCSGSMGGGVNNLGHS